MRKKIDICEVGFVKRYVIGNHDPTQIKTNAEIQTDLDTMNNELESNKGVIIGNEKNFIIFQIGDNSVVMQYITYHIGFKQRF
jgi:hypothetical protein